MQEAEAERKREGKEEGSRRQKGEEGKGGRKRKERGAERADIHLSDATSVYVFRMEKLGRHRRRLAVSVESPATPGVQDARVCGRRLTP